MLLRLIYDDDLAQAAYLIGCQRSRSAILIDPERDVDRYLDAAAAHGLRITDVAETHLHADFLSGAHELAVQTGATVHVSGEGGESWQSRWLEGSSLPHIIHHDGDVFQVGGIEFRVTHTPGHTPEHLTFTVRDAGGGSDVPMGIITGDFVFVGDVGRPDLLETAAGVMGVTQEAAEALAESARAFLSLEDHLQIWPAHGSGSACGKSLGAVPQSTVGYERQTNEALKLSGDPAAFVEDVLDGQPEPPLYFARMKAWNRDGVPLLGRLPALSRIEPSDLPTETRVVDVRPWAAYRESHLPGSIWSAAGMGFLMAVGSYIEPEESIALVAEDHQVERLVRNLVRIGLDRIVATIDPAQANGASTPEIAASELPEGATVVDVRRASEWRGEHLDGAVNIAHTRLLDRLEELPAAPTVYVHCAGGVRSAMAVSELRRRGVNAVNIAGGFAAMRRAGVVGLVTR